MTAPFIPQSPAPFGEGGGLLQPQSAVGQLLASLLTPPQGPPGTGSGPMPPMAAPIPSGAPPMTPPQASSVPAEPRPSMVDRIKQHLGGLLSMNAPAGYDGLLSPDEIQSAKPSFMSRLASITPGAPTPGQQYTANLNNIVQMHGLATQVAEQRRLMENRRTIEARFPLPPNPTMDDLRNNLAQRYDAYIGAGDADMAKEIGASLRGIMTAPKVDPNKVVGPGAALVGPDGKTLFQGQPIPKTYPPQAFTAKDGSTIWVQPGDPIPDGAKPIALTKTELSVNAGAGRADEARIDRFSKQFDSNVKPLRDRAALIEQALMTVNQARNSPDPNERHALYSSALANFVQAADQKAQIRYQLLQYFKQNIDPSIGGKWDVLKNRVLEGKLPDRIMEGMLTHLGNLKALTSQEIEAQRGGWIKRHPELDSELPHADEFFPMSGAASATPSASTGDASALYAKYGLAPKKP